MNYSSINLEQKLTQFTEHWSPRIIAQMNDYHLKLAKVQGEFVWHDHPETDEVFIVVQGQLDILFRDGKVSLDEGEMFVVPKGRRAQTRRRTGVPYFVDRARGLGQYWKRKRLDADRPE
jgi:mannose-6-phosphate isomerase-like protein (cupin superfamily)